MTQISLTGEPESKTESKKDFVTERHYECISALQKFIRRGMEFEAGRVLYELADYGHLNWALNRLKTIAYEDCSLDGNADIVFALQAISDCRELYKARNSSWKLAAAKAVIVLSRCPKSRIGDHFQAACSGANRESMVTLPDYCYDKHTLKGKKLGRGVEHFRDIASHLENKSTNDKDVYETKAYEYWNKTL